MKKRIIIGIISGVAPLALSGNVMAMNASVSPSASSVAVGESFTVMVNISDAAAWNVHLSASGPVSDCTIAEADATSDGMNSSRSFTTNCQATGEGTITLSLGGDMTDENFNTEALSGGATVTVYIPDPEPGTPEPEPSEPEPSGPETSADDAASRGEERAGDQQSASKSEGVTDDKKTSDDKTAADKTSETKTTTKTTTNARKNNNTNNVTNGEDSGESEGGGVPIVLIIVLLVVLLAGVGVGIFFLVKHFKKPKF